MENIFTFGDNIKTRTALMILDRFEKIFRTLFVVVKESGDFGMVI